MRTLVTLAALVALATVSLAEPVRGPIIRNFGPVYYVPDEPLALEPGENLKVVFDVAAAPDEPAESNYRLEAAARFLNLNARAGVSPERMKAAVVLHGRATRSALDDEAFAERYGEAHPDAALLDALTRAGVEVHVCGQSASAFDFTAGELRPDARLSASAMTALVRLQSAGYALIPWGTQ